MSNYAPEASPWWASLPDAVALSCLAPLSRLDLAALAMTSKSHRSLVTSPELCLTRSLTGYTEASLYVCLRICPDPIPRWFILTSNPYGLRLSPIPSNPYQASESSSFVVVGSGIYVIGGVLNDGNPTSDVWLLDCLSHTWRQAPSMKMARASASASLVDGKIYVFGGCGEDVEEDSSNWAEVFDTKTQTWDEFITPKIDHSIKQSVVLENKLYAVDDQDQSFHFSPRESSYWTPGINPDSASGVQQTNDWCTKSWIQGVNPHHNGIENVLFGLDTVQGRIMWCIPQTLDWKEVKGMKYLRRALRKHLPLTSVEPDYAMTTPRLPTTKVNYGTPRLGINSAGNLFILWNTLSEDMWSLFTGKWSVKPENTERLGLCYAEISLKVCSNQIGGTVLDSDDVLQLSSFTDSSSIEVLYSASVDI